MLYVVLTMPTLNKAYLFIYYYYYYKLVGTNWQKIGTNLTRDKLTRHQMSDGNCKSL